MAEFGEHLEIDVEDHGLAEAAAEARELAKALDQARDAAGELAGAGGGAGAGLDEAAASAAGLSRELGSARDNAAELSAAMDSGMATMGLGAAEAEAEAEALGRARDNAVELAGALTAADAAGAAGGGGGFLSQIAMAPGSLAAFGVGALVAAPAIAAVATAAVAAASGIAAATAGVGAFAALAVPSVEKVKGAYTNLTGAKSAYHAAVELEKRDPTTSNLAAQAKALAVLQTAQARFNKLSPDEKGAVKGIEALKSSYQSMAKAFEPDAFKVFNKGLHLADTLLPHLSPFAKTAAHALDGLLGQADKFAKSKGFETWLNQFHKLEGPSLKSIGTGIGTITNSIGKLMTTLSAKDDAHAIAIFFDSLSFGLNRLSYLSKNLSNMADDISTAVRNINHALQGDSRHATIKGGGQGLLSRFGVPESGIKVKLTPVAPSASALDAAMGIKPVKVKVIPASDYTAFDKSLAGHPVALKIKPVTAADMAAVMGGGPGGSGGSGGPKVKATAEVDKVDASHIKSAATNVKIHGATVDLSNAKLSGLSALSGTLGTAGSTAGKAFSRGLANAIKSGGTAAVTNAAAVASAVKGAVTGMYGAGHGDGEALGHGMRAGIIASTGGAVAAAASMASQVEAAAKVTLGISSPSKVFKKIGQETVKGFILGLQGGKSEVAAAMALITGHAAFKDATITDTIKKITKEVATAYKDKKIGKGEDSQLTGFIRSDNRRLMALAKQRSDIEKEIKAADALAKSVASSARQGGSIATLQGAMPAGSVSAAGLEQGMTTQLAAIKKFRTELKQLKKEGASKSVLRQVAAEGVTQGGAAAQALLAGGKGAIAKISQLQHQIAQAAKGLGKTAANASYESGSQIGKGLAAGLKGELKGVVAAMKDLAKKLVDEIKKALKIHSPSGVMIEIGAAIPAGLAVGIRTGTPVAVSAMHGLSGAVAGGAPYGHGSGHPNGTSVAPMIHVHVHLDGRQVAQSVQSSSLQRGRRNVAVGLKPANRGA